MTASPGGAGRRIRAVTLDPQGGRHEQAARRAILEAGVERALSLAPSDPRSFGERAQLLRDARPDVVVIALADRGAADRMALLAEALRFGCASQRPAPRVLLATSDDGAVARAAALLKPFEIEVLGDARGEEGRRAVAGRLREMRRTEGPLWDEALEELARGLARATGTASLAVDVTGSSTSLCRADADGGILAVHARPIGVGAAADRVIARAGLDRVRRWIPWAVDAPTLLERVFARSRWPDAVPAERETLAVEIALTHEAIALALAEADAVGAGHDLRSARFVLVTGRAAAVPSPARTVLILADSLGLAQPASIARDERDALLDLATQALTSGDRSALDAAVAEMAVIAAIVPVPTSGSAVLRLRSDGLASEERVSRGALFLLPPASDVELGGSGGALTRLVSGPLGLVVDARPHPITLPVRDAERLPIVARWYETLGAMPSEVAPSRPDRDVVRA